MNPIAIAAARLNWRTRARSWRSSLYLNSSFLMAANIVAAAFGFLYWTVAARLYPAADVGLAAATISAIGLVSMLASLGLDYALVRFLPDAADPQTVINSSMTIAGGAALVLSIVFMAGLDIWSPALLLVRTRPVLLISFFAAAVFTTVTWLLSGTYLARRRADLALAQASVFSIVKVLLAVGFAFAASATGLVGAWTIGLALAAGCGVGLFLVSSEGGGHQVAVTFKREVVNDMTHFAFANYVSLLLWSGPGFVLPLLVVNLLGPSANAHFYIAWSVGGLIAMVPMAVSLSLFAHGSIETHLLEQQTVAGAKFVLLLLLPAVAAILLLGDRVLLLFGPSYSREGLQLLRMLTVSTLPMAVNYFFFSVRRVQQRMGGVIASATWILVVTVGISVVLVPRLGLFGVGMGWFAAQASSAAVVGVRYLLSRR